MSQVKDSSLGIRQETAGIDDFPDHFLAVPVLFLHNTAEKPAEDGGRTMGWEITVPYPTASKQILGAGSKLTGTIQYSARTGPDISRTLCLQCITLNDCILLILNKLLKKSDRHSVKIVEKQLEVVRDKSFGSRIHS
jgi:hypothetical protein